MNIKEVIEQIERIEQLAVGKEVKQTLVRFLMIELEGEKASTEKISIRQRVLAYVQEHPNVFARDICLALDLDTGVVQTALSRLSRARFLEREMASDKDGNPTHWRYAPRIEHTEQAFKPVSGETIKSEIIRVVTETPGMTASEIMRKIKRSSSSVSAYCSMLGQSGELSRVLLNSAYRYYPATEKARQVSGGHVVPSGTTK